MRYVQKYMCLKKICNCKEYQLFVVEGFLQVKSEKHHAKVKSHVPLLVCEFQHSTFQLVSQFHVNLKLDDQTVLS